MAIGHSHNETLIERFDPSWSRHFDPVQRQNMLRQDSTAFRIVSLELVSIITLGFLLIAATVAIVVLGG